MSFTPDSTTAPLGRLRRTRAGGLDPRRMAGLLAVLLITAIAGYVIYSRVWGSGGQAAPPYSAGDVTRQTLSSSVNASGTVNSSRQVKLSFATAGRVSTLSVKQGDSVQQGQAIALLDSTVLQIRRDTAQSQLASAQARLQDLLNGTKPADLAAQLQAVAGAQAALTTAQNNLNNLLAGNTAEDIAAAKANLDRAQAALDVAQTSYDKLVRGEDLTLRSEYAGLQQAKSDYQTAQTNYDSKVNPNPSDVAAAQASLTGARSGVDSAQAKLTQLQNPNPADIAAAQGSVSSAQAQLEAAKARYASLVIGGSLADRQAAQATVDAAQAALVAAQAKLTTVSNTSTSTDADIAAALSSVASAQANLQTAQNNLAKLQGQTAGADLASAEQAQRAAEAALATAQNNLNRLLSPAAADVAAAQQLVASAQATLSTGQSTYDKLVHPSADDLAQVQAALDRAKAALVTAQTNWDRLVKGTDLDQRTEATALKSAQADYQSALASYTAKAAAPKPGDVQAAQAGVNSATASLTAAQARLAQLQAGAAEADLAQQQESVRPRELALQGAQNDLDNATLRAPFTGTVVSVGANEGDQVSAATAVVTLLDPSLIRVDATLDESGVARVKAGQQAIVTFDAIQGQQFTGQVASVTPSGTSSNGVVTFPVTVVFDPRGVSIPSGLTATVRVVVERKENALTVPSRAIKRSGRDTTVDVLQPDGSLESRPVQVGITGENNQVEILSGLNEGDKVAIPASGQRTGTTASASGTSGTFGTGVLGGSAPVGAPPGR